MADFDQEEKQLNYIHRYRALKDRYNIYLNELKQTRAAIQALLDEVNAAPVEDVPAGMKTKLNNKIEVFKTEFDRVVKE